MAIWASKAVLRDITIMLALLYSFISRCWNQQPNSKGIILTFKRITPPYSTCVHNTHVVYKKGYIMCSKRAKKNTSHSRNCSVTCQWLNTKTKMSVSPRKCAASVGIVVVAASNMKLAGHHGVPHSQLGCQEGRSCARSDHWHNCGQAYPGPGWCERSKRQCVQHRWWCKCTLQHLWHGNYQRVISMSHHGVAPSLF